MFSHNELRLIGEWAKAGQEILTSHMQTKFFSQAEIVEKRNERIALEQIIERADSLRKEFVDVDTDHMIHLLTICAEHQERIKEQWETAELGSADYAAEVYAIGYIQGRAEIGLLTQKDLDILTEWEAE